MKCSIHYRGNICHVSNALYPHTCGGATGTGGGATGTGGGGGVLIKQYVININNDDSDNTMYFAVNARNL